jgi:isocitrate dehydrogenase
MEGKVPKITVTKNDEAPYLATFSLLPAVKKFLDAAGIEIEMKNISLAGRTLANFPDYLKEDQKVPDDLAELGERVVDDPDLNLIKLPNISAAVPQLKATIKELQSKGYNVPDYPEEPKTEEEKKLHDRYAKVLGSAVNPVIRQGNCIRMVPNPVKESAKKYPELMAGGMPLKEWSKDSKTHVAHMDSEDFYEHEKSVTVEKATKVKIEFTDENGNTSVMKELPLTEGEILDGTFMNVRALQRFYEEQIKDAKKKGILWSLHLKATMMKVSDPVMFGYAVKAYFKDVFEKHAKTFEEIGVNPNNGLADLYLKIQDLPEDKRKEIEADIQAVYDENPPMFMVDSGKGITNLHSPNLVIIDASNPTIIRDGGKAWGPDNKQHDTKIVIPDRCYAPIYKEIVEDCERNGAFDRATMGTVINIGLMAMKAEEYGSHDKTFMAPSNGTFRVVDESGKVLIEHKVEEGDIWRACQVKDIAVKDWAKLGVEQAKRTGYSTIFWLDENRGHDAEVMKKVNEYLKDCDTTGLDIRIMKPQEAMRFTAEKVRKGEHVISVTGNVLRDYLTDLFPITEAGTSAKVLSIVPLLVGGRLSEAGAGGSAPKHVWQLLEEGHSRWDSTAEFTALTSALRFIEEKYNHKKAKVLADTSDKAVTKLLLNKLWPSRKVGEHDNRGEIYYFIRYWAEALAEQDEDKELKEKFEKPAKELAENESKINEELIAAQGHSVDIGGYYLPDEDKIAKVMRPSPTLNAIVDAM